ncbi:alpha/beta hydrolase [Cellulosimicrobium sp. Marseille-Q4280]|uniref:alpha/beta hydrolase n=1 Tax=Cellulosimicrobium sp. Marseille-Q4280 TaxID=2937992 RepID=UPI0020404793|nr:alpha/beta hydrolase [Cellulosimicrobium sp. Marseille-Q4280]
MDDVRPRTSLRGRGRAPRVVAGLAVLAVSVPLGACSPPADVTPTTSGTAALERYYEQELVWTACGADHAGTDDDEKLMATVAGAECARLSVPLDYDDPEGDVASVAVLRVPARGESRGPMVINPGGPGGSGVTGAIITAAGLAESPITESFDVVGFDPRGVGATRPAADCYSDEEADAGTVPLGSQGTTVAFTEDDTRAIMEKCAERSGGMKALTHMGTRDTARDMDVLRAALGQDELTYFGQSYGTRLGVVYAEMFPERVRAMLLDGGRDSREGTFESRVNAYAGFQGAFDEMAASCATQESCPLGTDPQQATARFQEIVRPLRDRPVPALETELGFDDAIGAVIAGLYNQAAWPRIIAGITEVTQGRGDEMMQLIYDFSPRSATGQWPNTSEANYAINCMDEDRLTPREGGELRTATYERAPFMDPGVDVTAGARDGCEHWPAEPTLGIPYGQDIDGLPATLVVSITGDPTTPHEGGIRLADSLGSALLTVEGQGHTIVAFGKNACVDEVAAAYLIDLDVPAEGTTCTM